jgi:hypothetical protein
MSKPRFVETSMGFINLSQVRRVVVGTTTVALWFDQSHCVEISLNEWSSVFGKMVPYDLIISG